MPMMMLLFAATLADAAAPAPLTPTSKWNVDYGATACLLGRVYGTGKGETIVALRQVPLASSLELLISTKDGNNAFRRGRARIAIDGGNIDESGYESFPTREAGTRVTRMPVNVAVFDDLPAGAVLRVSPEKMGGWAFALPSAKAAFAALAKCNDATVKQWGIDPTERERIAIPARAVRGEANWLSADDYPKDVLGKGAQGTTVALWTITTEGKVADCRIVVSSGEPELDKAACRAITLRGRYTPALGADSKPMVSHQTQKIRWQLPGTWSGRD